MLCSRCFATSAILLLRSGLNKLVFLFIFCHVLSFVQLCISEKKCCNTRKAKRKKKPPNFEVHRPRCVGSITKNIVYYTYSRTQLYFTQYYSRNTTTCFGPICGPSSGSITKNYFVLTRTAKHNYISPSSTIGVPRRDEVTGEWRRLHN